jgi:hypothetical protein
VSALPFADPGDFNAMVVGLMTGGVICWVVVRRSLSKPSSGGADGSPVTDAQKRTIWQTAATIFAAWALLALVIAVVRGEAVGLVLAIVAFGAGLVAVIRLGLPRDHPAWRWVSAAISRR